MAIKNEDRDAELKVKLVAMGEHMEKASHKELNRVAHDVKKRFAGSDKKYAEIRELQLKLVESLTAKRLGRKVAQVGRQAMRTYLQGVPLIHSLSDTLGDAGPVLGAIGKLVNSLPDHEPSKAVELVEIAKKNIRAGNVAASKRSKPTP